MIMIVLAVKGILKGIGVGTIVELSQKHALLRTKDF